ncbi:50S ribosomal protein L18 [Psittacicella gerlachiana]|uniref:Large ribosomal subunit protein uL18 n=1 Tax=Psittacicella gerlachiana TaxID=2028574 RepID=A0A3A1Y923_9GAMM|nr:50S ribosomal protein L18 [Psittacicella gerlachiana]RIY34803.1 50S ribosomal protein L18 [Psittacicella gerlachiana]
MDKKSARIRRATSTRKHLQTLGVNRLVVFRTSRHIYAQVISPEAKVLATASTVEKALASQLKYTGNVEAAAFIGKTVAERLLANNFDGKIAFDRSGFKYHGRVKALADAAREAGLKF